MKTLGVVFILLGFVVFPLFPVGVVLLVLGFIKGKTIANPSGPWTYRYSGGRTAIALDATRCMLSLKAKGTVKEYPFADVRGWERNSMSGGHVMTGGMGGVLNNIHASARNRAASGLFVQVRDIDHPVWRIDMPRPADQQRWMEILQQYINES